MGSIQNPKQYCFAISSITTRQGADKLDAWGIPLEMPMSNFDSKDFWAWQENVPTVEPTCREYDWSPSLNKGKWKSYWGLQPDFSCAFFVVWIVVTVSVTRQTQIYIYVYICPIFYIYRSPINETRKSAKPATQTSVHQIDEATQEEVKSCERIGLLGLIFYGRPCSTPGWFKYHTFKLKILRLKSHFGLLMAFKQSTMGYHQI